MSAQDTFTRTLNEVLDDYDKCKAQRDALLAELTKTNIFLETVAQSAIVSEPARTYLKGHIELNNAAIAHAKEESK